MSWYSPDGASSKPPISAQRQAALRQKDECIAEYLTIVVTHLPALLDLVKFPFQSNTQSRLKPVN